MALNCLYKSNSLMRKGIYLLFVFLFLAISDVASQSTKESLQQQKKRLDNEIQYIQKQLDQTKKATTTNETQVKLLNKQISNQETYIRLINNEVEKIRIEVGKTENELQELEQYIKGLKDEYAQMIYYSYLTRNTYHRLMFIFASDNLNEAFLRLRYLQEYANAMRRQADLIKENQQELDKKITELNKLEDEKQKLLKESEVKSKELIQQRKDKDKVVRDLKTKQSQLLTDIKKKQENVKKLQKEIDEIIRREIEESKKREGTKKVEGGNMFLTPAEFEISKGFTGNKGKLPWPVEKGVIIEKFGVHQHPIERGVKTDNKGIDISTAKDAIVKPVFEGVVSVVITNPFGSKTIVIKHGQYLTVYTNLYALQVKKGDKVNTNTILGKVQFDTQNSIIHFEVWKEMQVENPENWLRK